MNRHHSEDIAVKQRRFGTGFSFGTVFLLLSLQFVQAQPAQTVQRLAPGVRLIRRQVPEMPWAIRILEIALKTPGLRIETIKAQDRLAAREKTSAMAARADSANHRVLAAINGDFFDIDGRPINLQICNGWVVRGPTHRTVFALTTTGEPLIGVFQMKIILHYANGMVREISGVNTNRSTDALIFYNKFWGQTSNTNRYGTEAHLRLLTGQAVNDTMRMQVEEIDAGGTAFQLNDGYALLSAHGQAEVFLKEHLAVGDTVATLFRIAPGDKPLQQAIGGLPRLLRAGKEDISWDREGAAQAFAYSRHPRTALGYTAAKDTLYMVVVDGRQPGYSMGMSLFELTRLLLELGCYDALNLDGGGSTTMVANGAIVNRPSDEAGERPVANAVLVVSTREQAID